MDWKPGTWHRMVTSAKRVVVKHPWPNAWAGDNLINTLLKAHSGNNNQMLLVSNVLIGKYQKPRLWSLEHLQPEKVLRESSD